LVRVRLACGEKPAKTPLTYKEASRRGKVRKNFRLQEVAFTVPLTSKATEWHASDSHFDLAGHITRDPMEKPDPYGEWVLHKSKEAKGGIPHPVDEQLLAAARAAWPHVLAHAKRQLAQKNSATETEDLAAEVWEGVLKSVSKAVQRKGDSSSAIGDLESYLFAAFHHRFNRVLKIEQNRRDTIELVSSTLEFERIESAQDTTWVEELERAITIRQITNRMDGWTRKVWQAREYGYSWKEIAVWSGLNEQTAKKRFEYGLEKTRRNIVRLLKGGNPHKSG
jgi:DNA-directed RNA polymerase specialized sigma24 family protein